MLNISRDNFRIWLFIVEIRCFYQNWEIDLMEQIAVNKQAKLKPLVKVILRVNISNMTLCFIII